MKKVLLFVAICLLASVSAFAVTGWRNLDEEHQLGGRKASEGYLQGKVVLVCKDAAQMARMETIWQSFKTKAFVLLGSVAKEAPGCTFPQYRESGLADSEPDTPLYVVGGAGKVVYRGGNERDATQAVVNALTDLDSPRTQAQWQEFLDFELENLPGRAYQRYLDFRKKFPKAAQGYDAKARELNSIKDVKKLAELVAFAKKAKDMRAFDPKKKLQQQKFAAVVKSAVSKYAKLRDSEDPRVAQETKNALADLKWTLAAL